MDAIKDLKSRQEVLEHLNLLREKEVRPYEFITMSECAVLQVP